MPSQPVRRKAAPTAAPDVIEAPRPLAPVPTTRTDAKPRKFTALLDAATDARYGRLLDALRESVGPVATRSDGNGRTRAGYDLSRADLLRALLEVADDADSAVMAEVQRKVRAHYGATS